MDEERLQREALNGDWEAASALRRERRRRGEPWLESVGLAELRPLYRAALEAVSFERLSLVYGCLSVPAERTTFVRITPVHLGGWPEVRVVASPCHTRLAFKKGTELRVYDPEEGVLLRTFIVESYPSDCEVALGAGGTYLYVSYYFSAQSGSDWSEYQVYDIASGDEVMEGRLHEMDDMAFHPDGHQLVIESHFHGKRTVKIAGGGT